MWEKSSNQYKWNKIHSVWQTSAYLNSVVKRMTYQCFNQKVLGPDSGVRINAIM